MGAEGGESGVVKDQVAADGVVMAPAEAGEDGLAVGGLGNIHRSGAEVVALEAPLRGLGRGVGQAWGWWGGSQGGQRPVVEGEVAADGVVPVPTCLGEHGLAVGGLGDVHRSGAEVVALEAPLRRALLALSRNRTAGYGSQSDQQGPNDQNQRTLGFNGPYLLPQGHILRTEPPKINATAISTPLDTSASDLVAQAVSMLQPIWPAGIALLAWCHSLPPLQPSLRES